MRSLDVFYREIDIAGDYMEHAIQCSMDMMDIQLFEESEGENKFSKMSDAISKFIQSVKEAVAKFFKKVKEAVDKKIRDFKDKVELKKLEMMWKKNINNAITITNYAEEKKIKALYKDVVSEGYKVIGKLDNCDDPSKVRAYQEQWNIFYTKKMREVEKLVTIFKTKCSISGLDPIISISGLQEIDRMTAKALEDIDRKQKEILFRNSVKDFKDSLKKIKNERDQKKAKEAAAKANEATTEKKSLITKISSNISSFGKKCGSMISNNKGKVLAALAAMGVTAAGIYEHQKKKSN